VLLATVDPDRLQKPASANPLRRALSAVVRPAQHRPGEIIGVGVEVAPPPAQCLEQPADRVVVDVGGERAREHHLQLGSEREEPDAPQQLRVDRLEAQQRGEGQEASLAVPAQHQVGLAVVGELDADEVDQVGHPPRENAKAAVEEGLLDGDDAFLERSTSTAAGQRNPTVPA
jgi:hypothetical protein